MNHRDQWYCWKEDKDTAVQIFHKGECFLVNCKFVDL